MLIGIKSSLDEEQLKNKLSCNPSLLELHLYESDVRNRAMTLVKIAQVAHAHPQMKLMLHSPIMQDRDAALAISDEDIEFLEAFYELCLGHPAIIGAVMHTEYSEMYDPNKTEENLAYLRPRCRRLDDLWYFENLVTKTRLVDDFIVFLELHKIKKVTVDLTHLYAYNTAQDAYRLFTYLRENNIEYYVHISDNTPLSGVHKPKNIGEGSIDFSVLAPHIEFGVIETFSADENKGVEMLADYKAFIALKRSSR